jgi:Bacterial Ig domain
MAGSKPQVVTISPAGGASLSSPVQIEASAYPTPGHSVTGWWIYVDSVGAYNAGSVSWINPKIKMSTGTHTVVVRAWDTSGAYGDQTFTVTASPLKPTVTVATPTNNATIGSPLNVQANASPTAGQTISSWTVYVDGKAAYKASAARSINTRLMLAQGKHTVIVRAWDSSTAYGDQTLSVTASAKPAVTVSTPAIAANVLSPIKLQASATPSSGHSITGWWVYVDGVGKYQAGAVNSISPSISASTGTHTVVVRAWDTSSAYGDQTFTVDVQPVAVNISNLLNGASVTSPLSLAANAASSHSIASWVVYVDSGTAYIQNYGNNVAANLDLTPGTHTLMVRSWDSTGAYGDQTIKVTVP